MSVAAKRFRDASEPSTGPFDDVLRIAYRFEHNYPFVAGHPGEEGAESVDKRSRPELSDETVAEHSEAATVTTETSQSKVRCAKMTRVCVSCLLSSPYL
jgi:hypothetical protein